MTFSDLDLVPELTDTVAELGYESPSPIQEALIPVLLSGRDAIGQARTGTGKTAAFALPALHKIASQERGTPRILVLAPTRELAVQVSSAIYTYGKKLDIRALPITGGQPYGKQIQRIRRGVDVVVATPGRLVDLIGQGAIDLSQVQTVILDEADEMFSMGFADDLDAIFDVLPDERQTALLSATMAPAGQAAGPAALEQPRDDLGDRRRPHGRRHRAARVLRQRPRQAGGAGAAFGDGGRDERAVLRPHPSRRQSAGG